MMKAWCYLGGLLVAISAIGRAAPAQSPPKWEYGRLHAIRGVPMLWIVGTKAEQVDSSMAVFQRTADAEVSILRGRVPKAPRPGELVPATLLMLTMNRLGADGWELVSIIPSPSVMLMDTAANRVDVEYFFKRQARN